MYVKTENNEIVEYPYSVEQFRADNPTTSFPAELSNDTLASYGVYPVGYQPAPTYDRTTQRMVVSSQPSLVDGKWVLTKTIVNMTDAEVAKYSENQAADMRAERNRRLALTDWCALSDTTMSAEMTTYRQALRDISSQEGFPHSVTWPTEPSS